MKRNKPKQTKADAILTADIHLSESTPISRIDDYQEAQRKKLKFLCGLQEKHKCPVLDAGDIFNHWKSSPWLLSQAYYWLPNNMVTIPGNHDLPEHSIKQYGKSALAFLEAVDKLQVFHWEVVPLLADENCLPDSKFSAWGIPYGEYGKINLNNTAIALYSCLQNTEEFLELSKDFDEIADKPVVIDNLKKMLIKLNLLGNDY